MREEKSSSLDPDRIPVKLPMKPESLNVATDYRLALLWLMDRLESARVAEVNAAFEREFGNLIPTEHHETNDSGRIKWRHYVAWSRFELVRTGLMGSGGRGVWTITPLGKAWLRENPNADHADLAAFLKQGGAEAKSGFQWRGQDYNVTRQALFSIAVWRWLSLALLWVTMRPLRSTDRGAAT